jgi:hypothetical protein
MTVELVAAPLQQTDFTVQLARTDAKCPTPSVRQERVADTVFTSGQEQVGALFLGLHLGLLMAHHLAVETFRKDDPEDKMSQKSGCRCCRT